jgi:CRP/FNR family transcriptional regulator, cyclic AMP receptor protein
LAAPLPASPTGAFFSRPIHVATLDFLASVPLFRGLDQADLARFAALARERAYPRGGVVLLERDPSDSLYIVRSGRVKLVLTSADGREVILGVLGVGEHFGELSLIDGQPRSAHVVAVEDAALIVLRSQDFRQAVEACPSVAWALLTELSRRLRRADDQIGGLALLDAPARIARLLLDNAGADGVLTRPLTHQVIAQMIGASRETVSRTLSDFRQSAWVMTDRRKVAITDRAALERRAQARL